MTDEQINDKAFKIYPVSLSTYNEEAVDVNYDRRQTYITKLKIIQKAIKEQKKENNMGTLIIIRNIMLYLFVSIIIYLSHDIINKNLYIVSHIVWVIFIVIKMILDLKHER